jgi:TatA/E family protein of Tat protein translocase
MPFSIGPVELIFVLVIALLVLGPGKLPEVGSALGKSIREFRKAASDIQDSASVDATATPTPTPPSTPAASAPTPSAPAPSSPAEPSAAPPAPPVQPNTLSGQSAPNEIGGERQA